MSLSTWQAGWTSAVSLSAASYSPFQVTAHPFFTNTGNIWIKKSLVPTMFRTRLIASPSLTSLEASVQILQMPNVYYFKKTKQKQRTCGAQSEQWTTRAVWTAAKKKKKQLLGCRRPHLNKDLSLSNHSKIYLFLRCLQTLIILWLFQIANYTICEKRRSH